MKRLIFWIIAAALVGVICAIGSYGLIILNGQKILMENINKLNMDEASIIYDADGNEITKMYVQNRELVKLDDVPEKLRDAFIATEDRRFATHSGIDFYSIGRALYRDIVYHSAVEGASTITQQLARNLFLSSNKTIFRKVQEASIAVALENNFTKDQILEMYLNRIYFGSSAYGIKAAAKRYFGVEDLNKLSLTEMAALASIPKAPGIYAPDADPEKAKERRGVVLTLMADQGYITDAEKDAAMKEELKLKTFESGSKSDYQTFVDYTIEEAEEQYKLSEDQLLRGGFKIYTTMNAKAQKTLEDAYKKDDYFQKDMNGQKMQSGMVIYDQKDGGIVAMIGGRDYVARGLNRTTVRRQPGSTFKPIVDYGPALESGNWNPYSMLEDNNRAYGDYHPHNYNNQYLGEVSMFDALKKSMNQPAVWTLNQVGLVNGMKFAEKLGIKFDPKDRNLAIALGGMTYGVTPLQMARAYGAFAAGGILQKPHAIVKIVDTDGRESAAFKPEAERVMKAQTSYYMTKLLEGVVEPGGTGVRAKMDRPAAGKTGSTQLDLKGLERYYRDIWFVGYTPEWTAAIWMGFDKTDTKHYVTKDSGSAAALFKEVMSKALAGRKVVSFEKPAGVTDLSEPPKAVSDLRAELDKSGRSVTLTWTPVGGKLTYQLYRKGSKEQDYTKILPADSSKMVDMTVQQGETYEYYVIAMQSGSNAASDKSNVVTVTIPPALGQPGDVRPGAGTPPGQSGSRGPQGPAGSQPPPGIGLTLPGTGGSGTGSGGTGKSGGGGATSGGGAAGGSGTGKGSGGVSSGGTTGSGGGATSGTGTSAGGTSTRGGNAGTSTGGTNGTTGSGTGTTGATGTSTGGGTSTGTATGSGTGTTGTTGANTGGANSSTGSGAGTNGTSGTSTGGTNTTTGTSGNVR